MTVRPYTVGGTGHRPGKMPGTQREISALLFKRLTSIRCEHPDLLCISGMAVGFDQWLTEICIGLGVPFIAAVPFLGQETRWPLDVQRHYHELLAKAQRVHIVCEGPFAGWKMQRRNEWIVDNCDYLIAGWNLQPSGTENCIRYAKKVGRLWENILQSRAA